MNNNNDNFESIDDNLDEGLGNFVSVSLIAALISVPGIVDAKTIAKNIPNKATTAQIQTALADSAKTEKTYGGFNVLQLANILTRTLYGEAKGESLEGKKMVATVIVNRAGGKLEDIPKVCFAKSQFSMWNNFSKKKPATFTIIVPREVSKNKKSKAAWDECKAIADEIIAGKFTKLGNYNAYLNPDTASSTAVNGWGSTMSNQITVGNHKFGYLKEHDGYIKANKTDSKYPSTYVVQKTDKGVSFIARDLIAKGKSPIKDLKKLTNKIIALNKLGAKATIHVGDKLKLPLTEGLFV